MMKYDWDGTCEPPHIVAPGGEGVSCIQWPRNPHFSSSWSLSSWALWWKWRSSSFSLSPWWSGLHWLHTIALMAILCDMIYEGNIIQHPCVENKLYGGGGSNPCQDWGPLIRKVSTNSKRGKIPRIQKVSGNRKNTTKSLENITCHHIHALNAESV